MTEAPITTLPADEERRLAAELFDEVWTLLERTGRTESDDDRMVHAAHASRHHWGQVGGPKELAIGEWQVSRVYAVLGRAEPALHHARRCVALATGNEVEDWLLASGYEAGQGAPGRGRHGCGAGRAGPGGRGAGARHGPGGSRGRRGRSGRSTALSL